MAINVCDGHLDGARICRWVKYSTRGKIVKHNFAIPQLAVLIAAALALPAHATIYGTMSNFDVYNETETEAHGAEIELEGIHREDLSRDFPSHFNSKTISEYTNGAIFGTRITYTDYNFNALGYLAPTVGQSTNGHACVNTSGCEHFGYSTIGIQPTAANYYWLDVNGNRINNAPMQVPTPSWTYIPPALPGGAPILRAEVEPVEVHPQRPDSIWMKVFKTELERPIELAELMSANGIMPEDAAETETEWELLEGGKMDQAEDDVPDGKKSVIRRYEYFQYSGLYDDEHEPLSNWDGVSDPPADEFGQFISANMVAANLEAPARTKGDYNGDGIVNAADYTVWRNNRGSEVEYHGDGNDDGRIDGDDYTIWRDGFGLVLDGGGQGPGPGGAGAAVPEPAALGLALMGSAILLIRRGRRCSTSRGRLV
jgi:hypothetical protein